MSDQTTLTLQHRTDHDFFEAFHTDLTNSGERVIILSPFISPNKTSRYIAAFQALHAKTVPVMVYLKPKMEQPDSLQRRYDEVCRHLEALGVQILLRPGMHEKIAVIDQRILWHGSLNILSHYNTRESMLRIESAEVAQEILSDLNLSGSQPAIGPSEEENTTAEPLAPDECAPDIRCPQCHGKMRLFENAGLWICEQSPRCPGTRPVKLSPQRETHAPPRQKLDILCPLCDTPMVLSRGLRVAIGCPNCDFRLDSRLSAGISRIIKRRGFV